MRCRRRREHGASLICSGSKYCLQCRGPAQRLPGDVFGLGGNIAGVHPTDALLALIHLVQGLGLRQGLGLGQGQGQEPWSNVLEILHDVRRYTVNRMGDTRSNIHATGEGFVNTNFLDSTKGSRNPKNCAFPEFAILRSI